MTIGQRLKSAREARKISLEEAIRVTKIQRRTIEAIEEDRVDGLLDPAYARIFLKKYASYLGIDGAALLEEYRQTGQHPIPSEPALAVQTQITRERSQRGQKTAPVWLVPAAVGLAAVVGIAFLGTLTLDLVQNLKSESVQPARKENKPAAPERALLVPLAKPLKLSVQTTADVWVQIKSDGSVIFQNVLPKGSQEHWTAKRELELWTGNAGAMQLLLNGKPLTGLGRGVRKGVRITHAGLQ